MTGAETGCGWQRTQKGFVLTADKSFAKELSDLWPDGSIVWIVFDRGRAAIESLFNEPPDILVVDSELTDISGLEVAKLVKSENVYRQLPVVIRLPRQSLDEGVDLTDVEADDFLVAPHNPAEVKARICLTINRASRNLDANPLSKLPGNTSIIQRIQELIDRREDFALAYVDLDHFKSFNDKYGFSRGDEVLMMTARIIVNIIRGFFGAQAFVGHVGGDDFVFIVPPDLVSHACERIIESFDKIVPSFYDEEDRRRGMIISTDRQGNLREFPLMAISIAVVFNRDGSIKHYGEASSIAMNLKKKAKENPRSSYVLDRRQPEPPESREPEPTG